MANTYEMNEVRIVDGKLFGLKAIVSGRQVTNDVGETVKDIKIILDYDRIPIEKLADYATGTLVIRRQNNVWKKMTPDAIREDIGKTISWDMMGSNSGTSQRPSIAATLANIMIANGVPQDKAIERASEVAKDPEKLKAMMELAGMMKA